jgi:TetR/AcrR family transcriptional regulator, transcriptional repressor for nem operon
VARPDTRQQILDLAENLIRTKGYNSFSYHDIATTLGMKSAAIHYHFPTKEVLGLEVIKENIKRFKQFRERMFGLELEVQLDEFIKTYTESFDKNNVCIVGAISVEYYGLPETMTTVMNGLANIIHEWLTSLLAVGKAAGVFQFTIKPEKKALLIISNLAAGIQLSRLLGPTAFDDIVDGIKSELLTNDNKKLSKNL